MILMSLNGIKLVVTSLASPANDSNQSPLQKASPLLTSITKKTLKSRVGETRHSLKILTVSDK